MHTLILLVVSIFLYWLLSLIVLVVHELGHVIASALLGVNIRGFGINWKGAYIVREEGPPNLNIWISAAGCAANIILGLLLLHTNKYLEFFGLLNFINAGANLLPIKGSDGDRILACWQMLKKEKQCPTHNNSTSSQH